MTEPPTGDFTAADVADTWRTEGPYLPDLAEMDTIVSGYLAERARAERAEAERDALRLVVDAAMDLTEYSVGTPSWEDTVEEATAAIRVLRAALDTTESDDE